MVLSKTIFCVFLAISINADVRKEPAWQQEGTYNIGAVFKIHRPVHPTVYCENINPFGIEMSEAFRYAINRINEMNILPENQTLGGVAFDLCNSSDVPVIMEKM